MNTKQWIVLTVMMGIAGIGVAANPFTDVPKEHWAYQSIQQLVNDGVVEGYEDHTFKGNQEITRYEMAQMTAKAMAHADTVDMSQQMAINRLVDEFSSELKNLGVRVTALDEKMDNVKISGDLRLRVKNFSGTNADIYGPKYLKNTRNSKYELRARVRAVASIDENTQAVIRLSTGNVELGKNSGDILLDKAFLSHNFSEGLNVQAGRTGLTVGQGLLYDDVFDGVVAAWTPGKWRLTGAYGYLQMGYGYKGLDTATYRPEIGYIQAERSIGEVHANGFYMQFGEGSGIDITNGMEYQSVYGFGLKGVWNPITLGGEWLETRYNDEFSNSNAWTGYIGYKGTNVSKPGSYGIQLQYFDLDNHTPAFSSTYVPTYVRDNLGSHFWFLRSAYVPVKNMELSLGYGFSGKDKDNDNKLPNYIHGEINYFF